MATFTYTFEELPLVIAPRIEGALINGRAEIEYSRDGSWSIAGVEVEALRELTSFQKKCGTPKWCYLPASEAIAAIIHGRLANEWFDRVQNAVSQQIVEDREGAADDRADARRARQMERA